ncbi:hypothetical protein MMC28_000064 [Mycoblastus sanguinarius]|nr:hypothetical protein [Mycoblastus sanguinarius]
MSSTSHATNHQSLKSMKHLKPSSQLAKFTKTTHSKKVVLHHPANPPPPDDWVLYPEDVVINKHSALRDAQARELERTKISSQQTTPLSDHHLAKAKAKPSPRAQPRRAYRRSFCLEHMSSRNCTANCTNGGQLADSKAPPPAPSPSRLSTPDLSDVEEDELWSCCASSESSESNGRGLTRCT